MLNVDSIEPGSGSIKGHESKIQTICRECPAGCGIWAYTRAGRIVDIQGDAAHPVNHGRLCARGSEFVRRLGCPERVKQVLTRSGPNEAFSALDSWESGLDLLADRLRQLKERYGADSLSVYCHRLAGADFDLGARRFARLWGTAQVYPAQRASAGAIEGKAAASGKLPGADWPAGGALLLVEADLASSHPVLFGRILEAQRRGAKICAVDSRFTPTLAKADMYRIIRPDSGNWVGLGLMKNLLEEQNHSPEAKASVGVDDQTWLDLLSRMPSEAILHATGSGSDIFIPLAHQLAITSPVTVITGRALEAQEYSDIWPALVNSMGWSEKPLGGWYPMSAGLPYLQVTDDIMGDEAAAADSLDNLPEGIRKTSSAAEPHALISTGEVFNAPFYPLEKFANKIELGVCFGSRIHPDLQTSHMVFPAAAWPERDELCFCENNILQWGRRIVAPIEGARTGLDFWSGLAERFGWGDLFPWKEKDGRADLRKFYDWALGSSPWIQGLKVDVLARGPCALDDAIRSSGPKPGPKAPLRAPDEISHPAVPSDADRFPLLYTMSIDSEHGEDFTLMQSGHRRAGEDDIWIHPNLGRALAIETGDTVIVRNHRASWKARAWLSRSIPVWMVRSLGGGKPSQVLVHKAGDTPERSLAAIKEMGL